MKIISLTVLLSFFSIILFAQKRMGMNEIGWLMTYTVTKSSVQKDSMLREYHYKLTKETDSYIDDEENMVSTMYDSNDSLLYVVLNTYDFEYYKRVKNEIASKIKVGAQAVKLGPWTCDVYPISIGSYIVGYGPDNSFIIGRVVPFSNYER